MSRFFKAFEEFMAKWFHGPLRDRGVVREIAWTDGEKFHRNDYGSWFDAYIVVRESYRERSFFLSIGFYSEPGRLKGFQYLYFDLDAEEGGIDRAREEARELARNVEKRFGVEPVTYFTGCKGYAVLVPLKEYVDWQAYQLLWSIVSAPLRLKTLDTKVVEPRRLHRIPFTVNIKCGKTSYIVDPRSMEKVRMEDFEWPSKGLDPSIARNIARIDVAPIKTLTAVKTFRKGGGRKPRLPDDPAELDNHPAIPPCMRNIISALKKQADLGHEQRLALVWFLKWLGYDVETVVDLFRRFVPDFNEKITRYQVEYAYGLRGKGEDWLMYSCRKMRELGMCLECEWDRNPVTYVYRRAEVPEEVKKRWYEKVRKVVAANKT